MFEFHRNENVPEVFDDFFSYNNTIHDHNTRQSKQLHFPKLDTDLGQRSLAYWGVKVWNTILKANFSLAVTPITFKASLKRILLNNQIICVVKSMT